ncbi:MAG: hypothetical protein JW910_09540, partial [Anaerolineae bacterium]|nr:hypothetical protein [Anaerolineae bacterium]
VVALEMADGSTGTITYVANADKAFPKERVEVFGGGAVAVLDNFRRLETMRGGKRKVARSGQDKGHAGECQAFVAAIRAGGPPPIPVAELVAVTEATFCIVDSLRTGEPVCVAGETTPGHEGTGTTSDVGA